MGRARDEEDLNRTLVAGLILEVVLECPALPPDPVERRVRVKHRLKHLLVNRLAGHLSLRSFRMIARRLDDWFESLYPQLFHHDPAAGAECFFQAERTPEPPPFNESFLEDFLENLEPLLPKRRHRKLDRGRLTAFLRRTQGQWFRLKDFEGHFGMDRKTAWEYVQKFLQAGLFVHNQGRAAAARYRLAPQFLQD